MCKGSSGRIRCGRSSGLCSSTLLRPCSNSSRADISSRWSYRRAIDALSNLIDSGPDFSDRARPSRSSLYFQWRAGRSTRRSAAYFPRSGRGRRPSAAAARTSVRRLRRCRPRVDRFIERCWTCRASEFVVGFQSRNGRGWARTAGRGVGASRARFGAPRTRSPRCCVLFLGSSQLRIARVSKRCCSAVWSSDSYAMTERGYPRAATG